jgi:5-methylcytosine-specific restriction endonuclease McrA
MDSAAAAYNLRWQTAPGLGYARQKDLLVKWKRQRRSCAYCSEPATTLDHIVPLSRGGTNWEGNLAPSCRPCNSSKNNWFVREWRLRQLTSVL